MLTIGQNLSHYNIVSKIGAGGMGEVYRAKDQKLGREVAIKVLPEDFARDTERMARFQREAKLLAALNHTNIATIYGVEDSDSTHALVMELAEGPTLADRIRQGPIPVEEAIPIARQMADALEYAHEKGIIHRDLKPANVKVAPDDKVKILDFGLAKAMEPESPAAEQANSPTVSHLATQAGVLLGTAAYMAPEQAKGKVVDRRADIWAFGCVLYEMLTGKSAFRGETMTETLAAVINNEPDWSLLPKAMPMRVRVLLQRCLQKDPKQRLRDMGDARISLDEVISGVSQDAAGSASVPQAIAAPAWRRALPWAVAALLIGLAPSAFLYFHQSQPAGEVMRFEIPIPGERTPVIKPFALSPDGRKLAFVAGANGQDRLWVRFLDTLEARPLDGTEDAGGLFWSPDSRYIAFEAQGKLKKVEAVGGPPVEICDAPIQYGGSWSRDDKIIFGSESGVLQVSASGGSPSSVTRGNDGAPTFLPDGRHFLYWAYATGIYVGSIDAKPQDQSSKLLLPDSSAALYVPSSDPAVGYVLFVRGASTFGTSGTLMAQRFDTRRLELVGDAVPIAEHVPNLRFSASATGVMAYTTMPQSQVPLEVPGFIQGQLTWFDREGNVLGTVGEPGVYRNLALSPDEKRVVFNRVDPQNANTRNLWLYEFAKSGVATRLTFDSGWDEAAAWSPDGSRIAFTSNRVGSWSLYQKASDMAREDELLYKSNETKLPISYSPDGRSLLYFTNAAPPQMWLLPLVGAAADRKPVRVQQLQFNEARPRLSPPDGRWIAYASEEYGKSQIYVRPFDAAAAMGSHPASSTPPSEKRMVSKDGGTTPLWRRDGKELFYLSLDGEAMAVDVSTSGIFQAGVPEALFKVPKGVLSWDVTADGKRFLMPAPSTAKPAAPPPAQPPFTVVLNWQATLKK